MPVSKYIKYAALTLFFLFSKLLSFGQVYNWAKKIGGTSSEEGHSICTDKLGNVYVTGSFSGVCDFDPGAGTFTLNAGGNTDAFFAKYDGQGNFQWAKKISSSLDDSGNDIAVNDSGYIFITGSYQNLCDFDPGPGTANLGNLGANDAFLAKYDNNGNYKFAFRIASNGGTGDIGTGVETDMLGGVFVCGYYSGTTDFDPGAANAFIPTYGFQDIFFARYDKFGNYKWAKHVGTAGSEMAYKMAMDDSCNIYVIGEFSGTLDFNPAPAVNNVTSNGSYDMFFCKYDSLGNYMWAKNIGSSIYDDDIGDISLDKNKNIYLTGSFTGTGDFDPGVGSYSMSTPGAGDKDVFFGKFTNNGDLIWVKQIGNTSSQVFGASIVADSNLDVYLTGYYQTSALDIDPGPPVVSLPWLNVWDMFLAKYDASGNFINGGRMASGFDDRAFKLHCDQGDNIYLTGLYSGTCDMDPLVPVVNLTSSGLTDVFIAKYSQPCTIAPTITTAIAGSTAACSGATQTYSVATDFSATSYVWTLPSGWGTPGNSNVINVSTGSSGTIGVQATNGCGTSSMAVISVSAFTSPVVSVNSGTLCAGDAFTISPSGASTYSINGGNFIVSPSAGTISYSVTGTDVIGCSNNTPAISTITVYALPNISVAGGSICPGATFTLNPSGAQTYTYFGGSQTVTPSSTTSYTVIGESLQGCLSPTFATAVVTVTNVLSLGITGPSTMCASETNILVASGGATSYTWSTGSNVFTTSISPASTTVYTLTGENNFCTKVVTKTITVVPLPTVSILPSNTAICVGQTATLTGAGATWYSWVGMFSSPSITVSPTSSSVYTVHGAASGPISCSASATFSLAVNPLPVLSALNTTVCAGQSTTLIANGALTYTWNGSSTGSVFPLTPTLPSTNYTLSGTDVNNCVATTTVIVSVYTLPTLTASSSNNAFCAGQSATLNATGATSYTWAGLGSGASFTIAPSSTVTYTVFGENSNACQGSALITITVNPLPTLSVSSTNQLLCLGQTATLTANGALNYTWTPGGTGTSIVVSPTTTTVYTIIGSDVNSCTSTTLFTQGISICSGITELNKSEQIVISPNPTNGEFKVYLNDSSNGCIIELYDATGKHLQSYTANENATLISINNLPSGLYLLCIRNYQQVIRLSKLIKE
ncbi:MAG: hypothetical protein K0S32_3296 [Bacteroidetes bacterium]|jgi:hypothetical protein|nr:hypothetical protein [Bacteroidota bacterium]